jgi:hypothetical protein
MRTAFIPFLLAPVMASAQPLCDSLVIESFTYDPFGNGLHIRLRNNSSQFLGDPHFNVLDDQGATIVEGQSFFFGVLPGDAQLHVLDVSGDPPSSPFSGALVFDYINADDEGSCTFPMDQVSLCPPDSCFPFQVFAFAQATPFDAQMSWTISDQGNAAVANGQLTFTADGPAEALETVCLPPGAYELSVDRPASEGQPFLVGVTTSVYETPPAVTVSLSSTGSATVPFTFFAPCIESAQGMADTDASTAIIALHGRMLHITAGEAGGLGQMIIMDSMGRTVHSVKATGTTAVVDMGAAATGAYILRSIGPRHMEPQCFFLP